MVSIALCVYKLFASVLHYSCGFCTVDNKTNPSSLIIYEFTANSTGVCITCTFLESSTATDCVAVVHQRISQLNSSAGLMNIESSHKFTRSGDTASGCIEGVNLEDYQVGVVGGKQTHLATSSNTSRLALHEVLAYSDALVVYTCQCRILRNMVHYWNRYDIVLLPVFNNTNRNYGSNLHLQNIMISVR